MTRSEIVQMFRVENPEITANVVSDALLHNWLLTGDKEVCAITRCIVSDVTFDSVVSTTVYNTRYDLTSQIPNFYDIDDYPGGGVSFDDKPMGKTTIAQLDKDSSSWRTRTAGEPRKYYRRGKYLYFDRPVSDSYDGLEIKVYCVLISDDFNNDNITPYNQLAYLEPFHAALVLYLRWKAKAKVGKPADAQTAKQEFYDYCQFMKKTIQGGTTGPIRFRPATYPTR